MKLKAREIRQLSAPELKEKVSSLEEELFNLRFQASMGQLANPLRMRIVKKEIARTATVLREKKTGEKTAAPKTEVKK
jgi:large subunit ribosomal protein L29